MTETTKKELAIGSAAPAFTLKTEKGDSIALSSFKDKKNVVLVFYPGDMTPGCTMQLCAIRDDWSKFVSADTVVFGVNHGDAESHQKFSKAYGFPFPILVDTDKKVSAKYDAMKTFFKARIIKRSVIGINKKGKIVYLKRGMPKNVDILKAMNAANA